MTWHDGDLLDDRGRALAHVGPWGDGVRWAWWVFGRALSENLHGGCESREAARLMCERLVREGLEPDPDAIAKSVKAMEEGRTVPAKEVLRKLREKIR